VKHCRMSLSRQQGNRKSLAKGRISRQKRITKTPLPEVEPPSTEKSLPRLTPNQKRNVPKKKRKCWTSTMQDGIANTSEQKRGPYNELPRLHGFKPNQNQNVLRMRLNFIKQCTLSRRPRIKMIEIVVHENERRKLGVLTSV